MDKKDKVKISIHR